jgi:membrane protease YdiL (CAAX protease family)
MSKSTKSRVFIGPNGIRAGWRLLIFLVFLIPLGYGASLIVDRILGPTADRATPVDGLILMAPLAVALLIATWVMTKIEGRSFADYGLPWRHAFGKPFWQGAVIGFGSLTALLLTLHFAGAYSFGPLALHGADILKYGAAWTVPLFISVLLEDFFYRGYLLYTLSTGIGFWPSAIFTSLLMGGMHYFNPGGHGLGPIAATEYCLVTCLVLRRTGNLWMPMGIHAAWGWGVVFFFGLPSSGFAGNGHLMAGSFNGATWLTGGEFGVEASATNLVLLALWGIGFAVWLRAVKYPNPESVPDPRQRAAAIQPA